MFAEFENSQPSNIERASNTPDTTSNRAGTQRTRATANQHHPRMLLSPTPPLHQQHGHAFFGVSIALSTHVFGRDATACLFLAHHRIAHLLLVTLRNLHVEHNDNNAAPAVRTTTLCRVRKELWVITGFTLHFKYTRTRSGS